MCSISLERGATTACLWGPDPGARRARPRAALVCFISGAVSVLSKCSSACCSDTLDSVPTSDTLKNCIESCRLGFSATFSGVLAKYLMFGSLELTCERASSSAFVLAQQHVSSLRSWRGRRDRGNPRRYIRHGREGISICQLSVRNEIPSAWMGRTSESPL